MEKTAKKSFIVKIMKNMNQLYMIVKMQFGSHLYGTATADSDRDYKGVFLPSKEEVLLGRIPKCHSYTTGDGVSKNTKHDIDTEIYSLHYFIKLACDGQTVALDMLHAPDAMVVESSVIWRELVANRQKFYSKNLNAFINYARRQASKYGIKGSRLNDVTRVLDILNQEGPENKLEKVWELLPKTDHCFEVEKNPNGLRQYQVCGKTFQETTSIGYVIPVLNKYYEEYGHRARLAAENKNIDWKAISHAMRAAYQVKEIFTNHTITFPLPEAEYLRKVKQGRLDYMTEVAPALEALMDEVEGLSQQSDLPAKVDRTFWDGFICKVIEQALF